MKPIPRKHFGQHFLQDEAIVERFIAALNIQASDHLVEIGPGQGALTDPLLKQGKSLDAIELDRDLFSLLKKRHQSSGQLNLYAADALKFDFASLKQDDRPLKVFGSLPYNISTPLFFHLLSYKAIIAEMVFMLQREVGLRLAAKANDDHYGRLSVMMQYHCHIELLFDVPKEAFYPQPKVQSSVLSMTPYQHYPYVAKDYALFAAIVRSAFLMRRKTLRNSLKQIIHDHDWAHMQIHSDLRAENLSVKDFVEMSNAISLQGE